MDRTSELKHLRMADANIAAARDLIERQISIVTRLTEGGHEVATAQEILQTMRNTLEAMEEHRRSIKKEIARSSDWVVTPRRK
jgi:hypothetical protein